MPCNTVRNIRKRPIRCNSDGYAGVRMSEPPFRVRTFRTLPQADRPILGMLLPQLTERLQNRLIGLAYVSDLVVPPVLLLTWWLL